MPTRRAIIAASLATPALAQSWPSQPIRLIVPFAAGGATDIFARMIAERLSTALPGRMVVENRPGAGGAIGAQQAARAAPDGYTLLVVTSSHTIGETLMPNRGYVLARDLRGVAAFNTSALAITAHPALPFQDLAGLRAHAQRNPGALSYGTTGNGTVNHLVGELLRAQAGIDWVHVPYRAGAEARNDLIAGRLPLMIDPVTNAAELVRDNRARAIAVTTVSRSAALPETRSIAEQGIAGFDVGILIGMVAPAAMPDALVARLNGAIRAALPELAASWRAQGAEPLSLEAGAWNTLLAADAARWAEVIQRANIRVE